MSTSQKRLLLNPEIANDEIPMPYPHLRMVNPDDAVALVLPSIPTGELPVICTIQNSTRQLAKIRKSVVYIDVLRKIVELYYVRSKEEKVKLDSAESILEVM